MKAFVTIFLLLLLILPQSAVVYGQSISGIVNSYYQVNTVNTVANSLTLNTTAGLSNGNKVLLIQMKGATINTANSAAYGDVTALGDAGNYEFDYICSISGNVVNLEYKMLNAYDPTKQVQLVSVPVYSAVTITGTLTASPWDPVAGTGGVIVIEATTSILINSNTIS